VTQEIINNQTEEKGKLSPPYIPFMTFNNFITWLETEGVPVKFDRSFWRNKYGGSIGVQLTAGLRFLGLLQGEFVQPELNEIIKAKGEERKKLLVGVVQKAYSTVDFTQLQGATPSMLDQWFNAYHLDGSAKRKAESFFINACKWYDIPLSKVLQKKAHNKQTNPASSNKPEKKEEKGKGTIDKQNPPFQGEAEPQDLYKIILSDGCELKLCSNRVFFEIEKNDRALIEEIVELMKKHYKK
jgi:hypothetical protein